MMGIRAALVSLLLAGAPGLAAAQSAAPCAPAAQRGAESFGDSATSAEAFSHLQAALGALSDRAEAEANDQAKGAAALQGHVNDLRTSINKLQTRFTQANAKPPTPEYLRSLDLLARATAGVAAEPGLDTVQQCVADIVADVGAKLQTTGLGANGEERTTVTVEVTTVRAGKGVSGYVIRSSPVLLGAQPLDTGDFQQPSSPTTSREFAPGVYNLFAFMGNELAGAIRANVSLKAKGSAQFILGVK